MLSFGYEIFSFSRYPGSEEDLDTFARRRAGANSWRTLENGALLRINCVVKDRKRRLKIKSQVLRNINYYLNKYLYRIKIPDAAIRVGRSEIIKVSLIFRINSKLNMRDMQMENRDSAIRESPESGDRSR